VTLTNFPYDPILDLAPWVGQRQASFRFDLVNRVSGIRLGEVHPLRSATLTHDTSAVIKRKLTAAFGVADTAAINPITDMISVTMTFPNGQEYPLGEYVFSDSTYQLFTSGQLSNMVLNDKMFIVDQQIEKAFSARDDTRPTFFFNGTDISVCLEQVLADQPINFKIEETDDFASTDSWAAGTTRGQIIEALCLSGGYFSPWFGNDGVLHFIKAFNPALKVPDFDWDAGSQVLRSAITQASNVLTAPNRFIVISNAPADRNTPTYGSADVPVNAPHSIENRGFVIPLVTDLQALTGVQCTAIANNLVQRQAIFQTTTITTAPDPRHDSYNVIQWQGDLWLELGWSMTLIEGSPMSHTLRKAYK
jgi:hypothetical protein